MSASDTTATAVTWETDIVRSKPARITLGVLRIVIGRYFLWAFIDKVFGFGFLTAPGKACSMADTLPKAS